MFCSCYAVIFAGMAYPFKIKIYEYCLQTIQEKVQRLQQNLADLRESAANETKSTAGDKYETALALLQTEQSNTGTQLNEALAQKAVLEKILPHELTTRVTQGSLVKTSKEWFFVSIALGRTVIDKEPVIILSPYSPLGQKLMGLVAHNTVEMNKTVYIIEQVY